MWYILCNINLIMCVATCAECTTIFMFSADRITVFMICEDKTTIFTSYTAILLTITAILHHHELNVTNCCLLQLIMSNFLITLTFSVKHYFHIYCDFTVFLYICYFFLKSKFQPKSSEVAKPIFKQQRKSLEHLSTLNYKLTKAHRNHLLISNVDLYH